MQRLMRTRPHHYDDAVLLPLFREELGLLSPGDAAESGSTYHYAEQIDLSVYDRIVLSFSGGKDSIAMLLQLLDLGVERDRIELWHHDVDGGSASGSDLMD